MASLRLRVAAFTAWVILSAPAVADVSDAAAEQVAEQKIAKLIEQLGDTSYPARQRAHEELSKLGYEAFDALVDAEASDDPEIAMQARYLVRLVRVNWTHEGDPKEIQQILKNYEAQSDERRAACIKQLSELPGRSGLPWLCRLVRFERSAILSKQAALAIIEQPPPGDQAAWLQQSKIIHQALDRSRRPSARWVVAWLDSHSDPAGKLKAWAELCEAERRTLEQHPQDTTGQIVSGLLRRKIELLERSGHSGEVDDTIEQMVLVERGDPASLADLIEWLAQRKAWKALDEVSARFAASLDGDPVLLYTLCEARRAQGADELVEKSAEKALKLSETPLDHKTVAERLLERGLTEWSDREFRYTIAQGPIASPVALQARILLSESLHDRLLELEAADVLRSLIEAMDSDATVAQQVNQLLKPSEKEPRWLRAKMCYYLAGHAAAQKNTDQQRKLLEQAFQHDPAELDVLIAIYRLGGDDAPQRAHVLKQIRAVVDDCRTAIDDSPDDASRYNELAWLVANTEGDTDEALRLSLKSLEMVRAAAVNTGDFRRVGQFLDTLAHCYFAKKDYANAVQCQTEAARLDPHSRAIARQLKVFREALEAQAAGDGDKVKPGS